VSIAAALDDVRAAIAAARARAGRSDDVTLVAVSKTQPVSAIAAAYDAGQRHFGENYVDEWKEKRAYFAAQGVNDIVWHFIGRVQSGNAKAIATADLVHGMGTTSQAEALSKVGAKRGAPVPVLVQLNVADEDTKNGFTVADAQAAWPALMALPGIAVRGFMAMPNVVDVAAAFDAVVAARDAIAPSLRVLSFGMSNDFDVAVAHGATVVRVGTRIFGARPAQEPR
jgi:pyridoxal phosphate enzyme (YggS family)